MLPNTKLHITHGQVHVEWIIQGFCIIPKQINYYVKSPCFSLSNSNWVLLIFPNGQTCTNSQGWIGLYLQQETFTEECCVSYTFEIKKSDGSKLVDYNSKHAFGMEENIIGNPLLFERSALHHNSKDIVGTDGSLTVHFTARIENAREIQYQKSSPYDIPTLAEDLKRVYLDKQYTDITIKVKNKELLAHKCILAARSKVFSAMFQHDMAEKCSGTVEIDDSDPDSFEDFIMYLYTGKLDLVSSINATSLFKDADKYDVPELRKKCVQTMLQELTVESFCDVIQLAIVYEESDLLAAVTDFFSNNLKAILKTSKWKGFLAENSTFGNELILKALDNTEKKYTPCHKNLRKKKELSESNENLYM